MKKPSLKSKLTADRIEEANRLLLEQNSTAAVAVAPMVSKPLEKPTTKSTVMASETENIDWGMNDQNRNAATLDRSPSNRREDEAVKTDRIELSSTATTQRASNATDRASKSNKKGGNRGLETRSVRITIDVPEGLHEKLKIKMILSKQTIKDYLLNFIERDVANFKF